MKKLSLILVAVMVLGLFAGCAGTPVIYYSDCTCPTGAHSGTVELPTEPVDTTPVPEGAVKTGLAIVASAGESKNATAEENGEAAYDVTIVAVTVDDDGIIRDCVIDSIKASVGFDNAGAIAADLTAAPATKNELGEAYGMKAYGGSKYEWNEQAAAVAAACVGQHYQQLQGVVVAETGYAPEGTDLATSASIYIGGYVKAVEAAAANAQHLGAQSGDELKLAVISSIDGSKSADAENAGLCELYTSVTALTVNGETITSCVLDAVQAKVNFDTAGVITSDLSAPIQTKNELGEGYGMKAWGGAIAEWNEQAASFAAYVTGKTAAEVAGIAADETTKPTDADLLTSVTIKIGDFQKLIAKACG